MLLMSSGLLGIWSFQFKSMTWHLLFVGARYCTSNKMFLGYLLRDCWGLSCIQWLFRKEFGSPVVFLLSAQLCILSQIGFFLAEMLILKNFVFTFSLLFTNFKLLPFLVIAGCYILLSGFTTVDQGSGIHKQFYKEDRWHGTLGTGIFYFFKADFSR